MLKLRVLVVASFDSFLRVGAACARQLESSGASVSYTLVSARVNQISVQQLAAFGFQGGVEKKTLAAILTKQNLQQYDVIILALGGLRTRRFMTQFCRIFGSNDVVRPITVALYPGLVLRHQLEGMMSRASCDILLLNSKKDYQLYSGAMESLGHRKNNALCVGLAFVEGEKSTLGKELPANGTVVFIGQPTIPSGYQERSYVVHQMVRLARKYPQTPFLIKPRHRPGDTTLHRVQYHYEHLLREVPGSIPKNLRVHIIWNDGSAGDCACVFDFLLYSYCGGIVAWSSESRDHRSRNPREYCQSLFLLAVGCFVT